MKLVTYDSGSGPAAGVLSGDEVLSAADLLSIPGGLRDLRALLELPDIVEMEIEGIGVLRSTISPSQENDPDYRFKAKEGVLVMPVPRAASETTSA
jgi:hypothetical protein